MPEVTRKQMSRALSPSDLGFYLGRMARAEGEDCLNVAEKRLLVKNRKQVLQVLRKIRHRLDAFQDDLRLDDLFIYFDDKPDTFVRAEIRRLESKGVLTPQDATRLRVAQEVVSTPDFVRRNPPKKIQAAKVG